MAKKKKKAFGIIFKVDPAYKKCPSCSQYNTLRRSRVRNILESIIKTVTIYKLYRCNQCGWRGYMSTVTVTWASLKALVVYLALAGGAAWIVRQFLGRLTV